MSSLQCQSTDVIAKEITIAVVQSMDIGKWLVKEEIPGYVADLYKTILKAVDNPNSK